jgi:hypothetical protein
MTNVNYTDPKTGKFAKGNPGKPFGAKSERAKIWSEVGEWFTSDGMAAYLELLEDMKDGNPGEYMKRYEAMLEYFAPKLSRATFEHRGAEDVLMTPEDRKKRIQELKSKIIGDD